MDIRDYRVLAKALGYGESVYTILDLYYEPSSLLAGNPSARVGLISAILWLRYFTIAVLIWAGYKLKTGTDPGRPANEASGLCKTWRNVIISILVFEFLLCFNSDWCVHVKPSIPIMRLVNIFIVHKFIQELNAQDIAQLPQNPMPSPPEFDEFPIEFPPAEE